MFQYGEAEDLCGGTVATLPRAALAARGAVAVQVICLSSALFCCITED